MPSHYRDEIDDIDANDSGSDGKSFEYKTKIVGKTPERPIQRGSSGDADQPPQPLL